MTDLRPSRKECKIIKSRKPNKLLDILLDLSRMSNNCQCFSPIITMFRNFFEELWGYKDSIPNKFTIHLGEIIRKARLESNMTQSELAERAYFSQTAISQIEQGKRDVSAAEILYFSAALDKPILFFSNHL